MTSALMSNGTSKSNSTVPIARPYLVPVPNCEPPFDDERSAASRLRALRQAARTASVGTPVGTRPRSRRSASPTSAPDTIVDAAVPGWSQEEDIGVRRTTTAELPAATRSGPVLARALVEVISGRRPLSQLRVHCAPDVFAGLQSRPVVPGPLAHLLTVRVCEPADGAAEVTAIFRREARVRALAFRIQGVDGRWRITALQTG